MNLILLFIVCALGSSEDDSFMDDEVGQLQLRNADVVEVDNDRQMEHEQKERQPFHMFAHFRSFTHDGTQLMEIHGKNSGMKKAVAECLITVQDDDGADEAEVADDTVEESCAEGKVQTPGKVGSFSLSVCSRSSMVAGAVLKAQLPKKYGRAKFQLVETDAIAVPDKVASLLKGRVSVNLAQVQVDGHRDPASSADHILRHVIQTNPRPNAHTTILLYGTSKREVASHMRQHELYVADENSMIIDADAGETMWVKTALGVADTAVNIAKGWWR